MKKLIAILLGLILTGKIFGQTEIKYSQDELKHDLEYLYSNLKMSHYNLFVNTPQKEYDKAYDSTMASIVDSLSLIEAYRLFQPFIALSELGHCTTDYPYGRLYGTYIQNSGKLFPINTLIDKNKVFVKGNYSKNDSVQIGFELLAINDIPIFEYKIKIYDYLSGDSDYLKNTILDMFSFPRLLWAIEETAQTYDLTLKNNNGKIINVTLSSIPAIEFEEAMSEENQVFNSERKIDFIDNIAYLKPGTFLNLNATGNTSATETFEKGEFYAFIDSAFAEILRNKSTDLIVDLRNNSGGDNGFSDEMMAYFADKPFRFYSKYTVKTSKLVKDYWTQVNDTAQSILKQQILSHDDGEIFDVEMPFKIPKPDSVKFKGDVYVLINRYSYSQATVTAAMIKDYGFGIIIGEETADVPTTYASIHQFNLPATNIAISYPKAFIVRPNGDVSFKGTIPHYTVETDMFSKKDKILDYTLDLIKDKN